MAVGNLVNIGFETGDFSPWDATSGSPALTTTTPIEGAYSMLVTTNGHVTKDFATQTDVWFLMEIQYAAYPTGTRNIAALRGPSGEVASIRVTSTGQLRWQIGGTAIYTSGGAAGAGVQSVLTHVQRNGPGADVYEAWVRSAGSWVVLFSTNTQTFSDDFNAVRVGGLNSGHDGTHRVDYIQVGTNSDLLPHNEEPVPSTGISNRIAPTRLAGKLGGVI